MFDKAKIAVILAATAVLALLFGTAAVDREPPDTLETVLKATGASFVEGEIRYFASLERRFLEMSELETILLAAAGRVGLDGGTAGRSEGDTYRVLDIKGKLTLGPDTHIVVQSNPGDASLNLPPQTYLLLICRDSSLQRLKKTASRLEPVLQAQAPGGQISLFLTGEAGGRKSPAEMAELAERAVRAVDGRVVEGMREEGLLSISAYTPRFDRYLGGGRDRINLNLALRTDSTGNKTVVLAGFPIIHGSY
jgi:hypothetical protein